MITNYQGQLLAANPANPLDELYGSTILVITHTENVAVGLQLNNRVPGLDLQSVAHGLGIWYDGQDPVYQGGNMGTNKVYVVHSTDWLGLSSVKITDDLAVTNDISIISALSLGEGPEQFRACAGFWMWEAGVLDRQMDPHSTDVFHRWEALPATPASVFEFDDQEQWYTNLQTSARCQVQQWF